MGSEARTRLGLAAVLLVTLLSYGQVFAPGDYPGPALLGTLIAGSLAMAARRFGLATVPTVLASLAALVWYVAFLFESDATFFGLPTAAALAGVGRAVLRAYAFSHIDYAPVPVRPGYVILLVSATWVAATLGELAVFRWRRPLLATLPAIVLFSLAMVVGTGAGSPVFVVLFLVGLLGFWGLESSHRLRAWGRWVTAWSMQAEAQPGAVAGSIARRMGAGCVAVAIVSPLFLPALGDGLLAWRNDMGGGLGRGGAGGGRIDPLVSIAPSLVNQSTQELFRVRAKRRSYWRLVALPYFDGETWRPAEEATEEWVTDSGRVTGSWTPDARVHEVVQEVTITGLRDRYLPAAVQPLMVKAKEPARDDDLRFHPLTGDLRIAGEVNSGFSYRVVSAIPDPSYAKLKDAAVGVTDPVFRRPPGLDARVERLRDQWIEGYERPYEQLIAIQDALRGGDYVYATPRPEQIPREQQASPDMLADFLLDTRTGYCQQFATAFAALSRSLGYPTRVVVGFLPGQPVEGEFVVRGTDAHAWPEVFFEHYGWVRFEPTPRVDESAALVPGYTVPPARGGGILGSDGGVARGLSPGNGDLSPARRLNEPGVGGDAGARGEAGAGGRRAAAEDGARWRHTFRRFMAVLVLAALVALATVPALKARRVRRFYRRAQTSREVATAAFAEFAAEAGELAGPRGAAESARAYAARVARLKALPELETLRLASLYERAIYGRPEGELDASEARRLARALRATLWREASWWERGMRLFSPRTLIG